MRTFPHELSFLVCHNLDLSIKSTLLTIITLRIQFCIHDILINKPDYLKHSRNIIFHIRYFHITDCSACWKSLELGFKLQFCKSVDLFSDKYMITVRNITLVRNSRNHSKSLLKTFCKLVGRTFNRRSVNTECNVRLLFPFITSFIHMLHDIQCKRSCLRICMRLSCHILHALIKPCISKRNCWISTIQKLVDRLTFFQTGQSSKLPQDRGCIGKRSLQTVMSAHQRTIAQLQPLIKDLPEFIHIASGRKCYIHQVDRYNALIKPAVELIVSILILPRT